MTKLYARKLDVMSPQYPSMIGFCQLYLYTSDFVFARFFISYTSFPILPFLFTSNVFACSTFEFHRCDKISITRCHFSNWNFSVAIYIGSSFSQSLAIPRQTIVIYAEERVKCESLIFFLLKYLYTISKVCMEKLWQFEFRR